MFARSIVASLLLTVVCLGQVYTRLRVATGPTTDESYGAEAAFIGDHDRDGYEEYAVGIPLADTGLGVDSGVVLVYDGRTAAVLQTIVGPQASAGYADELGPAGDVDGNGKLDFVVVANGVVRVFEIESGALVAETVGESAALVGDVDLDGRDELVVGDPAAGAHGEARIVSWDGTTSLATDFTVSATVAGQFGRSVCGLGGDLDGDGIPEFVVGQPYYDTIFPFYVDAGRVQVLSGATGALITEGIGDTSNDRCGLSVAAGGDCDGDGALDFAGGGGDFAHVYSGATGQRLFKDAAPNAGTSCEMAFCDDEDGDGKDDFIVGEPVQNPADGRGQVRVLSGASGAILHKLDGEIDGDFFGTSVSTGDATGDGRRDLLVGAPEADVTGPASDDGAIYLFTFPRTDDLGSFVVPDLIRNAGDTDGDGVDDVLVRYISGPRIVKLVSGIDGTVIRLASSASADFGRSMCNMGDVDGDGVPDYTIGDPSYSGDDGRIQTYSGATGALIAHLTKSGGGADLYGYQVANVGDLDADGVDDLGVVEPLFDWILYGNPISIIYTDAGRVVLYSGATGSVIHNIKGTHSNQPLAYRVEGVGDVTADGTPDFAFLLGTSGLATIQIRSGANGQAGYSVSGFQPGDAFGLTGFTVLGDVDGDGVSDFAVGAHDFNGAATETGRTTVFSGASGAVIRYHDGIASHDHAGYELASPGDIDGDGVRDLAVGSPDAGLHSSVSGRIDLFSGATGALIWTCAGTGYTGLRLAPAGDPDRDGLPDLFTVRYGTGLTDVHLDRVESPGPRGVETFGEATPGCDPPVATRAPHPAVVGSNAFTIRVTNAPPSDTGWLVFSGPWARDDAGADVLGIGLLFHVNPFVAPLFAFEPINSDAAGFVELSASIPDIPSLAGFQLEFQSIWYFGACAPATIGYGASNGLEVTIVD